MSSFEYRVMYPGPFGGRPVPFGQYNDLPSAVDLKEDLEIAWKDSGTKVWIERREITDWEEVR